LEQAPAGLANGVGVINNDPTMYGTGSSMDFSTGFHADLIVEDQVIVANERLGPLINFNVTPIKTGHHSNRQWPERMISRQGAKIAKVKPGPPYPATGCGQHSRWVNRRPKRFLAIGRVFHGSR
jgi:hypothetical protein